MASFISIYTLTKLDNILVDYKKTIIKDFYENYIDKELTCDINYQQFENLFLERINSNEREIIVNNEKCLARVLHNKHGFYQCNNGRTNGNFCLKHVKLLNYGRVDN
jgi:hypothetical protein